MIAILTLFCLFALFAALINCRRVCTALPCFTVSVAVSAIFEMLYQPFNSGWLREWYHWLIWPVLFTRAAAVGEAVFVHSEHTQRRAALFTACAALAILMAAILAWRMAPGGLLLTTVQLRRVVMVGLTAFLSVYVLLIWSLKIWRHGIAGRHVIFLLLICLTFTIPALLNMRFPGQLWWTVDPIAYGSRGLLYLTWCLSISIPDPRPDPRVREAFS